jgi:hypothetical protein
LNKEKCMPKESYKDFYNYAVSTFLFNYFVII